MLKTDKDREIAFFAEKTYHLLCTSKISTHFTKMMTTAIIFTRLS